MHQTIQWRSAILLVGLAACADGGSTPLAPAAGTATRAKATTDRARDDGGLVARGRYRATVAPSVFGTVQPIQAHFRFDARKASDGTVSGQFAVEEYVDGTTSHYRGTFTCFGDYDFNGLTGNRAKVGGILTESDDPTSPVGSYLWWQAIDNDHAPTPTPNQTTLVGGGDNAANEAFCASSNPPKFGQQHLRRNHSGGGPTVMTQAPAATALPVTDAGYTYRLSIGS
jgi:hypothetical protein